MAKKEQGLPEELEELVMYDGDQLVAVSDDLLEQSKSDIGELMQSCVKSVDWAGHHGDVTAYQCMPCGFSFGSLADVEEHEKSAAHKSMVGALIEQMTGYVASKSAQVDFGPEAVGPKDAAYCAPCDVSFARSEDFKMHEMRQEHHSKLKAYNEAQLTKKQADAPVRRVRIFGGPGIHEVRIVCADTKRDLFVRRIEFVWDAQETKGQLVARLDFAVAEVDLDGVVLLPSKEPAAAKRPQRAPFDVEEG